MRSIGGVFVISLVHSEPLTSNYPPGKKWKMHLLFGGRSAFTITLQWNSFPFFALDQQNKKSARKYEI